jgi:hypothetical protein
MIHGHDILSDELEKGEHHLAMQGYTGSATPFVSIILAWP